MLLLAAVFKCIDPILTIAASLCGKSPFVSPADKRDEASSSHSKFALHRSDSLAICHAYNNWSALNGRRAQEDFCFERFLSSNTLQSMSDLRRQFKSTLKDLGYLDTKTDFNANSENINIVKTILVAGLYPNIASIQLPQQQYEQTSVGAFGILPQSNEIRFYTKEEGRVFIHPSSVLFKERKYKEQVLTYCTKVSTSKLFLRDCTVASPIGLLMLGGELELRHHGNTLVIDNLRFRAFPRISVLVNGMRTLLELMLESKIQNPNVDILDTEIGSVIVDLLSL